MDDLISRQAAIAAVGYYSLHSGDKLLFADAPLKALPSADTVKHGRWIEQEHGDWRYSKEYRCSECGKYRLVTTPEGWEWHYCPNCGAKMTYEEDDHDDHL